MMDGPMWRRAADFENNNDLMQLLMLLFLIGSKAMAVCVLGRPFREPASRDQFTPSPCLHEKTLLQNCLLKVKLGPRS